MPQTVPDTSKTRAPQVSSGGSRPLTTLAGVWSGPGRIGVEERTLEPVGFDDVLVRVRACGICGSDVHLVDGTLTAFRPPRVLGHEPLGIIEAIGDCVSGFAVGDRVTWEPSLPCGKCFYCHAGEDGLCESRVAIVGAFSERTVVPSRALQQLPDGLDDDIAVLAEPLSCALYAHRRVGVEAGDSVLVIGAGTIGLLLVALARFAGAGTVIASDPNPARRALAKEVGADLALDPGAVDLQGEGRRVSGGRGVDVAFEAVGSAITVSSAIQAPRPGGRVALVGLASPETSVSVPLWDLLRRDIVIHAVWLRKYTFQAAVELLPYLPLSGIVTDKVPLDRIGEGFELARTGKAVKVVVEP